MDFFERQWSTYRTIVDHDLMEHQALSAALRSTLNTWLAHRQSQSPMAPPPSMVDLGCGDLALLAPLLRQLPLGSYTGIDLTPAVLPLAQAALGPVAYPTEWRAGDLLNWAINPANDEAPIDILHSAFAIHHLSDEEKSLFLREARQRLSPTGCFLWADVFRQPEEPITAYNRRYSDRVRTEWSSLTTTQRQQVIDHLTQLDQPADRSAIQTVAEAAGWHWQWIWQGHHESEALAMLIPGP